MGHENLAKGLNKRYTCMYMGNKIMSERTIVVTIINGTEEDVEDIIDLFSYMEEIKCGEPPYNYPVIIHRCESSD